MLGFNKKIVLNYRIFGNINVPLTIREDSNIMSAKSRIL
ncbi:3-dehydroquinate dehydratase, partial [Vibrio parahaemolyticus]